MEKTPLKNQNSSDLLFRPITEGLGFHPFSDGLPYAPMGKGPKPSQETPSQTFGLGPALGQGARSGVGSGAGSGAVAAGPPRPVRSSKSLNPRLELGIPQISVP